MGATGSGQAQSQRRLSLFVSCVWTAVRLPRGERMRLTRSGAALLLRRARALIFATGDPIALAGNRTRLVPRLECPLENKVPRASGGTASVPGAFISPVSVHEPPGRATTTTEKPRLKLQGTRRTAGRAPRPPLAGPESELEPWPSRGRRIPAWTRNHDGPLAAPSPAFRAGYFTEVAPQLGLLAPGH